jgi:cell division protein FtsL
MTAEIKILATGFKKIKKVEKVFLSKATDAGKQKW